MALRPAAEHDRELTLQIQDEHGKGKLEGKHRTGESSFELHIDVHVLLCHAGVAPTLN